MPPHLLPVGQTRLDRLVTRLSMWSYEPGDSHLAVPLCQLQSVFMSPLPTEGTHLYLNEPERTLPNNTPPSSLLRTALKGSFLKGAMGIMVPWAPSPRAFSCMESDGFLGPKHQGGPRGHLRSSRSVWSGLRADVRKQQQLQLWSRTESLLITNGNPNPCQILQNIGECVVWKFRTHFYL